MPETLFIEPMVQKDSGDCGIACIHMLSGRSYTDVVKAAPHHSYKHGMTMKQIVETAATVGLTLRHRRKYDLSDDRGILGLIPDPTHNGKTKRDEHVVLLLEGHIYDTYAGRLWLDIGMFLQQERYRVGTLLRVES